MAYARLRVGIVVVGSVSLLSLAHGARRVEGQEQQVSRASAADKGGLPLKAERKLAFDTDEGTWVSLDVSPDGKTIVFELAGEIWASPARCGGSTIPTSTTG